MASTALPHARPYNRSRAYEWITTVDHKKIGILYVTMAFGFFLLGGIMALFIAGFTPIPFKLFTIAAGFNQTLDMTTLVIGSIIGRSSRFFLVGALLNFYGASIKSFLDRYFDRLSLAFVALLLLGFLAVKLLA